jgi:hypothetical protein
MKTDGVVMGALTPHGDHTHLEWVCPDCGNAGYTDGARSPYRIVCSKTGRQFLIVGVPQIGREVESRRKGFRPDPGGKPVVRPVLFGQQRRSRSAK